MNKRLIRFACVHCGSKLETTSENREKVVQCPSCTSVIRIRRKPRSQQLTAPPVEPTVPLSVGIPGGPALKTEVSRSDAGKMSFTFLGALLALIGLIVAPTSESVTWEVAREKLAEAIKADGKRPKTIASYLETLDKLTAMFCLAKGPADVTDRMAGDFKTKYANGRFTRRRKVGPEERAADYARKAKSLDSRIRTLKAAFSWFNKLRLVEANPFDGVTAPELHRHEVKYVKQGEVNDFFTWLEGRFPGWAMPRLFFSVKALSACRLDDLCHLRSSQLEEGRLVFAADQTKNRSGRYAVLPPELYAELDAYKGKTFLWERYPPELMGANKRLGFPTHRQNPEFAPRRLYLWVVQLMQGYQNETGKDLSSHDFRRAAFTRAAEKDVHPKRAAVAFDVTAETMLRYYTATEKKRTADEVLGGLADDLLPRKKTANGAEEE